ncbi:hypothetical protein VTN00DRAFT_9694 [Thermoascus crustaceus]|uniref:uncharacterized protein n=1 Tax=Thermoascus crustaceus TaxID=5088 RepID=UPI003742A1A4
MTGREIDAETPYLQVNLDMDPLHADQMLQQAILINDSRSSSSSLSSQHKRKHSHLSSTSVSQATSDTSGRFDDAEESEELDQNGCYYDDGYDARSVHSIKRRRSNDWPLRDGEVYNEYGMRVKTNSPSANRRGSPRSSAAKNARHRSCSPGLGPARRSRFIEGSMNDRASKMPPRKFTDADAAMHQHAAQSEGATNAPGGRQSGIFRFGKVIASAFNPFGMLGNKSDIWKGPHDCVVTPKTQKEIMKERQKQAEKAYAELKKSGYKGTSKGTYMQQESNGNTNRVDPSIAAQTPKAIQEKTESKNPSRCHSRQDSSGLSEYEGSQTTSTEAKTPSRKMPFQDLRKAKSALSIPSTKRREQSPGRLSPEKGRGSEDTQDPGMRKQQSRKDLARQAKLLKKVSNLEEKLERARRELRELTGEPDVPPVPPLPLDYHHHPRLFVPGALPSLPSERIIRNCLDSAVQTDPIFEFTAMARNIPRIAKESNEDAQDDGHINTKRPIPGPKPRETVKEYEHLPTTTIKSSPSLKRKSPVDTALNVSQQKAERPGSHDQDPSSYDTDANYETATTSDNNNNNNKPTPKRQPPRKAKLPKIIRGDSPGSVGRKQRLMADDEAEDERPTVTPARSRARYSSPRYRGSKQYPSPRYRSKSPSLGLGLKAKKARADLRAASTEAASASTGDNHHHHHHQNNLYLQNHNPSFDKQAPAVMVKGIPRGYDGDDDENIPPIPPVPKDLISDTAKVDANLIRSLEMIREEGSLSPVQLLNGNRGSGVGAGVKNRTRKLANNFEWPDDFF